MVGGGGGGDDVGVPRRPPLAHVGRHDDRVRRRGRFRGLLPADWGMGGGKGGEEVGSEEGVVSRGWREAARALGGEEKLVSGGVLIELLWDFIF